VQSEECGVRSERRRRFAGFHSALNRPARPVKAEPWVPRKRSMFHVEHSVFLRQAAHYPLQILMAVELDNDLAGALFRAFLDKHLGTKGLTEFGL
jgi:hypothetical protein